MRSGTIEFMRIFLRASVGLAVALLPTLAVAAASLSINDLSPGSAIVAKSKMTFSVNATGFSYPTFNVSDTFHNSSASASNIDPGGHFVWVPTADDVGTHTFTISAGDNDANYASINQTIVVMPLPTISIGSLSPGNTIKPGTKLTFVVSTNGFLNPTYVVADDSSNPSVSSSNLDASGHFSWTPGASDLGQHVITVYASDSSGHSNSASVTIQVGDIPSLTISSLSPGPSVHPNEIVTFNGVPLNYSPTGYSITDSFAGSTLVNNDVSLSGQVSWVPRDTDIGVHVITITGTVGAFGTTATASITITVKGTSTTAPSTSASTTSSISVLQTQLAQLQSKIASQSSAPPAQSQFTFTLNLQRGSSGNEVTQLQKLLTKEGLFSGDINGLYGPITMAAVTQFQGAHGISMLGTVGPATRAALNEVLSEEATTRSPYTNPLPASTPTSTSTSDGYVFQHFMGVGDDDPDVLELQKRLSALGFFSGDLTGYYGTVTEAAVKHYQTKHGLTVTGYVASETRTSLNQ